MSGPADIAGAVRKLAIKKGEPPAAVTVLQAKYLLDFPPSKRRVEWWPLAGPRLRGVIKGVSGDYVIVLWDGAARPESVTATNLTLVTDEETDSG